MSIKTISESVFEEFCTTNKIVFEKIEENQIENVKTPDYMVTLNGGVFIFEIKQLDKDIRRPDGSWTIVPGESIRKVMKKKTAK